MAQPKSLVPLADMLELLTQARERIAAGAPGIKVTYTDSKSAKSQWFRLSASLRRLQERSRELFPLDDHRYGRSGYEDLSYYPEDNALIIRPATVPRNVITIEDLEL